MPDNISASSSAVVGGNANSGAIDNKSLPPVNVTAGNLPNIVINPLEKLATYNYLWTMAALTPEQYNNPLSYRKDPSIIENVVFSSAGRFDDKRARIQKKGISPEYSINNLTMLSVIAPGLRNGVSNAITIKFEIHEPTGIGLLLQSLQSAAINAGYVNYLKNCPYLLQLDFIGYEVDGDVDRGVKLKNISRYIVVRLLEVDFDVNETGSTYRVQCQPYNELGFSDIVNRTWTDLKITGTTVQEVLLDGPDSLSVYLNNESKRKAKAAKIATPDEYLITFPYVANTAKQASTKNPIGSAGFNFNASSGGAVPFAKAADVYRNGLIGSGVKFSVDQRVFQFPQGQTITKIIEEVVLNSEWGKKVIDPDRINVDGTIDWFKIDVQIELIKYDPVQNDFAKKINYIVVPYKIHSSIINKPTANSTGYDELVKTIAKSYNYIHTGENNDLLTFDLQLKNTFFNAISPGLKYQTGNLDPGANSGGKPNIDLTSSTAADVNETAAALSKAGYASFKEDGSMYMLKSGGAGADDVRVAIARDFHNAVVNNNADLVNIQFEILGDPYWLTDSGIANYYSVAALDNPAVTIDGAMTYEGQDVYVYLQIATPVDIDENTGRYLEIDVSPFSGIYKITEVTSTFNDGIFKQRLTGIRMRGQPEDYDKKQTTQPKDQISQQSVTGQIDPGLLGDPNFSATA
jgi:hypothetical protein